MSQLARKPGLQSGKYSANFDKVVKLDDHDALHYEVAVPLHRRAECARTVAQVPMLLAHEALCDEYLDCGEAIRARAATATLPRVYTTHPVTVACRATGMLCWPVALYVDGVKFAREDNAVGFWMTCLLTGRRWSLANLRKSELCNCGCKGWCSVYPILAVIGWSCRASVLGRHPNRRHDNAELDAARACLANVLMQFRTAVLFIKGDWMEFSTTLAYPSWRTAIAPCPRCWCTVDTLYSTRGLSAFGTPRPQKSWGDYCHACNACEHHVDPLTDAMWRKLRAALIYDKKKDGGRGRVLGMDVPEVGLLKGDRLECTVDCPDIGSGFNDTCPPRVTFWRRAHESITRHRNPLFHGDAYITPDRCLVFDYLHSLALGVYKTFMSHLVWALILRNAWQAPAADPPEARLLTSVPRLRLQLTLWYQAEHRAGRKHNVVQDLTVGMMGTAANPNLALHGAEMVGFLAFGECLLNTHGALLGDHRADFTLAWRSLNQVRLLTSKYHDVMPDHEVQPFVQAVSDALGAMDRLDLPQKPKAHAMIELAAAARTHGSPAFFACWEDESMNVLLRGIAATAHRSNWHWRVLRNLNASLQRRVRRRLI